MKAAVLKERPGSEKLFNSTWDDDYVRTLMSQPSKKDAKKQRTFEYSMKKLVKTFDLYQELKVDDIMSRDLKSLPDTHRIALECGSLYWRGYDRKRRPVLWVRNPRKDYTNLDLDAQRWLHIRMIETGVRELLPPGTSRFVIVADAGVMKVGRIRQMYAQMRQVSYLRMLIKVFLTLYPDRVAVLMPGPVNRFLRGMYNFVSPLLPRNVVRKIRLLPHKSRPVLEEYIDAQDVPDFFGGEASHEDLMQADIGDDEIDDSPLPPRGGESGTNRSTFDFSAMCATQRKRLESLLSKESPSDDSKSKGDAKSNMKEKDEAKSERAATTPDDAGGKTD